MGARNHRRWQVVVGLRNQRLWLEVETNKMLQRLLHLG